MAVLEKRWEAEERTFNLVTARNEVDSCHSNAESQKCFAKTKKLEAEACALEMDNTEKLLFVQLNL